MNLERDGAPDVPTATARCCSSCLFWVPGRDGTLGICARGADEFVWGPNRIDLDAVADRIRADDHVCRDWRELR